MRAPSTITALLTGLLLVAWSGPAFAVPQRIAVVVGNNNGGPSKTRLRYAESDARRVTRVLGRLGGVTTAKLLLGATAGQLRRTLSALERQVKAGGKQVVLFFYYSGHADHRSLLMGSTRFGFAELRRVIKRFPARTAVAIVDACQSGQVVRSKGGRVVPVMDVKFDDEGYRGRVYITSSAAGENAQESDELKASFFTHYLLSGLRGAADDSGDGKVSLEEAYRYAYRLTVARTAGTIQGPQHPSYNIELRGRGQLTLTWLSSRSSYLLLPRTARGTYYILRRPNGMLMAEVKARGRRAVRIALAPGRYRIKKIRGRSMYTQTVRVPSGGSVTMDESLMVRRPLARGSRKGGGGLRGPANAVSVSYHLQSGYLTDAGLLHGVHVSYLRRLGPVDLGVIVGYGNSTYLRDDNVDVDLHELTGLLTLQWRWRGYRWIRPVIALDVGAGWVRQAGRVAPGDIQIRSDAVFVYRGRVGAECRIWGPLLIGFWGHAGQAVVRKPGGVKGPFVWGGGIGITFEL